MTSLFPSLYIDETFGNFFSLSPESFVNTLRNPAAQIAASQEATTIDGSDAMLADKEKGTAKVSECEQRTKQIMKEHMLDESLMN